MDENGGSGRRKRGRPAGGSIPNEEDTFSSKKRRVNEEAATTNSPSQLPAPAPWSFSSAISNALSHGRKTNGTMRTKSQEYLRQTSKEERATSATMPARREKKPGRRTILRKPVDNVYDIPPSDSDESPFDAPGTRRTAAAPAPKKVDGLSTRGKPKEVSAVAEINGVDELMAEPEPSVEEVQIEESPTKAPPPQKRGPGRPPGSKTKSKTNTFSSLPRGLEGRRGADAVASSPVLKGILTPSKDRNQSGEKRRKSVAFGLGTGSKDVEVFFEDLPTKKKARLAEEPAKRNSTPQERAKETDTPAQEEGVDSGEDGEEEEADDEVCEICLKPDSKSDNQIIFCDNCDLGYHQKCHNVAVIPEGDWICKSCLQEDISKTPKKSTTATTTPIPANAPDIPNLDLHLRSLQRALIDRCTGRKRLKLRGLDDAHIKVQHLVEQTITAGEGNSMLLIGGRGCGKTTLIEEVVATMTEDHGQDFHVVRLNGFVHTDDKLALKEIWRQLGKEMEVEDELVHRTNYADTMASLLALLSHPSEIMAEEKGVTSQSVIFIIDEFDMFAYHPRQTLLYNLFDIAQARKAPIAVLGCTTRLDVVEMLEKRVKSRFSHRYVYIAPPRSLPAYWDICRQGLIVDKEDAVEAGLDPDLGGFDEFTEYWSRKIERLHRQEPFQSLLQGYYYTSKSVPGFLATCILPLASLSPTNLALQIPHAPTSIPLSAPPSKLHLLASLSNLDLALLIAAARLDIVAHTDTVNFAMAYDEYGSLMGRQRVQSASSGMLALGGGVRVWGRGVAGIAWERLIDLGLLIPAGLGGGRGGHGGLEGRMYKMDVALEEIPAAAKLNAVLARWCKEI